MDKREEGPVEILCKEIDYRFDRRMETPAMLVAFVRVLVSKIATMRHMQERLTKLTGKAPSAGSADLLKRVEAMLACDPAVMIPACVVLHNLCDELNPDEAYPTDHLIDMLSSCVSAVRFGLEMPCRSRHAASAAKHVWKHVYGVTLFDNFTPAWENEWVRAQLQDALLLQIQTNN